MTALLPDAAVRAVGVLVTVDEPAALVIDVPLHAFLSLLATQRERHEVLLLQGNQWQY